MNRGLTLLELLAALAILSVTVATAFSITHSSSSAMSHATLQREVTEHLAELDAAEITDGSFTLSNGDIARLTTEIVQQATEEEPLVWTKVTVDVLTSDGWQAVTSQLRVHEPETTE